MECARSYKNHYASLALEYPEPTDYQTKTCCRCDKDKPLSEFYKDSRTPDGLYCYCKSCHKQLINSWRQTPEGKAQLKVYFKTPEAKATRKRYSQTPKGKTANYRCSRRHIKKYPQRARCRWTFSKALRRGKIIRPSICSLCNIDCKPHGHHPDYSKPYKIVWLCRKCHRFIHLQLKEEKRA